MKQKVILLVLIALSLFLISSCGSKNSISSNLTININNINITNKIDEKTPNNDNTYVSVVVSLQNNSNEALNITKAGFNLIDSQGEKYNIDQTFKEKALPIYRNMQPGESNLITVVFQLPKEKALSKLQYVIECQTSNNKTNTFGGEIMINK
ncbi:MAG: DUF4352 domain-containing protein [Syntrophomonas sp.]